MEEEEESLFKADVRSGQPRAQGLYVDITVISNRRYYTRLQRYRFHALDPPLWTFVPNTALSLAD